MHPGQAAGDQAAQERQPPGAVLGGGDVQAQELPPAVSVHASGDQRVHVHRPAALADLLCQRVDPRESIGPGVQPAGPDEVAAVPRSAPPARGGPQPAAAPLPAPISAAARRFAGLPPAVRHDWLVRHLAALRAGRITLAQLP